MKISRNSIPAGSKLLSGLLRKKYKQNYIDDAKSFTDEIKERDYADVELVKAAKDCCCTFVDLFSIPATL
jgi:hypothetical protein